VRNTGASRLDLVEPGDFRTVDCWRTAWGAHEVLEEALVHDDLAAALEGVSLAVAFTGRRRSQGPSVLDVRDAAAAIAELANDAVAALVFGPEANGLSNDELALCGSVATIPADPAQPSYNLSHAVAIAAYEVARAGGRSRDTARALATHDQKEGVLALLEPGLVEASVLPRTNTASYFAGWRALLHRIDLTPQELGLLEHLARRLGPKPR
jgi:TrmH family RNA methyltransferase